MTGSRDDDLKFPRRPKPGMPDEVTHRLAHEAANQAAGKLGKVIWAYESMYWDEVAKLTLVSLVGVKKGHKLIEPGYAAEMAAEYADALLAERKKRVKRGEGRHQ